jgi:hypothetical protein
MQSLLLGTNTVVDLTYSEYSVLVLGRAKSLSNSDWQFGSAMIFTPE